MEEQFDLGFYKRIIDQLHANVYVTDIETDQIPFEYNRDSMFDAFSETVDGYIFAGFYKRIIDQLHANVYVTDIETDQIPFEYNRDSMFDAFSETVDGYIFAGNLKTGTFMYSRKMVREFGLPRQIIEEAVAFWGENVHPEDREFFLRSNQEVADGKTDRYTIRYRARNSKGKWVQLLCKGRVIPDKEGAPSVFVGMIYNLDDKEIRKKLNGTERASFY